jgi:hypothetical protein
MAGHSFSPLDWIEFGVRTAITLVEDAPRFFAALRGGDLNTTEELGKRLSPGDQIIARSVALKAQQAAIARANAHVEAEAKRATRAKGGGS